MSVIRDPELETLLAALHARSDEQIELIRDFYAHRAQPPTEDEIKVFRSDKFVALDRDKAEFCYQLCRANDARRIVEVGTSYGVSTLYLAAAIRDNTCANGGDGVVISTEYEPHKASAARAHFKQAGLSQFIELREGDLRETLKEIDGPVDFLLVDIWIAMARPALERVAPYLRPGAIVLCDNTKRYRNEYADYFAFLDNPANEFRTMTLPFEGGLELSVRCPISAQVALRGVHISSWHFPPVAAQPNVGFTLMRTTTTTTRMTPKRHALLPPERKEVGSTRMRAKDWGDLLRSG